MSIYAQKLKNVDRQISSIFQLPQQSRTQSNARSWVMGGHWLWGNRTPEPLNFGVPVFVGMLQDATA